jgi:hypothetical protein
MIFVILPFHIFRNFCKSIHLVFPQNFKEKRKTKNRKSKAMIIFIVSFLVKEENLQ